MLLTVAFLDEQLFCDGGGNRDGDDGGGDDHEEDFK